MFHTLFAAWSLGFRWGWGRGTTGGGDPLLPIDVCGVWRSKCWRVPASGWEPFGFHVEGVVLWGWGEL